MVLYERYVLNTIHNRIDIINWQIINGFKVIDSNCFSIDIRLSSTAEKL